MGETPHVHLKTFCDDDSHELHFPTHAQPDAASRHCDAFLFIPIAVTETSSATVNPDSSNPASDEFADSSTTMTGSEGYHHYGIND